MKTNTDEFAEIEAMKIIANAVKDLDDTARNRVLAWANGKYNVESAAEVTKTDARAGHGRNLPPVQTEPEHTTVDLPAMFAAANPESGTDKALVVAYWFQVLNGQADVDSFDVNKELKHLGHGALNITRAFDHLMEAKPQLVIQKRKSGKAKQARKKYRVTAEGISRVKQLMAAQQPQR